MGDDDRKRAQDATRARRDALATLVDTIVRVDDMLHGDALAPEDRTMAASLLLDVALTHGAARGASERAQDALRALRGKLRDLDTLVAWQDSEESEGA